LRRVLSSYFQYHHDARTHLSLNGLVACNFPLQAILLPSPRSAGCIIAMSVEPREIARWHASLVPTRLPSIHFRRHKP
jgi:hypothetical protein